VLNWHYNKEPITVYIYEYAQLCCKLLPLCQESIQFRREAVSLCPEGHSDRDVYLHNLTISLELRFNHQGNPNDLDEAISLHEEVLCLWPIGHRYRHFSLNILVICFDTRGDIDDITRTVNLYHGALALHPPGNPRHGTTLNNLTLVLKTRYDKLYVSKDLNDPERHVNLFNSSSALCFRFTHTRKNEDIEEVINLCQESLAALSSLHPDRELQTRIRHPTQGFSWRISEAINWARQAEVYRHESALEAYQMCFELFDSHAMTQSHGARFGNIRQAVELVEQGREQQWPLASRLRTPLEDLKSTSSQLA
ncbi:hypothetical protein BDR03DRAFT_1019966, partial [Suillus americanus]